jgi:hypothetical protein
MIHGIGARKISLTDHPPPGTRRLPGRRPRARARSSGGRGGSRRAGGGDGSPRRSYACASLIPDPLVLSAGSDDAPAGATLFRRGILALAGNIASARRRGILRGASGIKLDES